MSHLNTPICVTPPAYEIPLNMWRWCKLNDVCRVVPGVAQLGGKEFTLTPEELVHHFAAVAKSNLVSPKTKLFRYSVDGCTLGAAEVPTDSEHPLFPPYGPFVLDIATPYPEELWVPEGWVLDTLKAIRRGAKAVADFGDRVIGFRPDGGTMILEGKKDMCLLRVPTQAL